MRKATIILSLSLSLTIVYLFLRFILPCLQRYDTVSPDSYRVQHYIFLLCMKSDRFAGSPFVRYMKEREKTTELTHYYFWRDIEILTQDLAKGSVSDQYR